VSNLLHLQKVPTEPLASTSDMQFGGSSESDPVYWKIRTCPRTDLAVAGEGTLLPRPSQAFGPAGRDRRQGALEVRSPEDWNGSPRREDGCPIAAGVSPVRPDGSPQRGAGSPKAADGSPHRLGGSPNRAGGSPNPKIGSPKSPGGSPKARFVSPIRADRSPRAARQLKRFPDLFERFRGRVERLRRGLERFRGGLDLRRELSDWFWDRVPRLHAGRERSGGRRGTLPGLA
jgi:hypothetical protein